jgi:hypothetical protein
MTSSSIPDLSHFNLMLILLISMAPKLVNPFHRKKRKQNENTLADAINIINDLYYYSEIGYSSDSNLLRQEDDE